jgi:CelD/BcsL family acetyltransferase involved in cellulose biosynthesis
MLKVETLRSAHQLDRLRERWTCLEQQCQGSRYEATLFQSYELNRLAARWFAARESSHVVLAESDCGLAIIPAVRRKRELGLIGETLFDYRDVLSAGDPAVLEHAWRELARAGLPLEVTALRGDAARERWAGLHPIAFCNAPTTRRAEVTAQQFVSAHHKSAKASRRLAREGLRLVRRESLRRESGLRQIGEWIYRGKAAWHGQSENLFLSRRRQDFMLFLIDVGIVDCTIWSYESHSGEVAAALVSFRHGHTRHFYTIHHDPLWERFSPGQVMIFDVTRESLAEGLDVDFMTGEYPYKNRLATAMVPLYRVETSARQLASFHPNATEAGAPGTAETGKAEAAPESREVA